jgi:pyrophosphate--fructose-6-phosphate 1-phosphotransferase
MEKSALQIARAAYQPKLPKALQGAVKVKEGAPTQSVGDQEEIKKLFPNTYGMPVVEFEPATEANTTKMNVGIILSGGQAPGGHNVITGLYDQIKKLNPENRLYGFILGPGGLVDHNYMELTDDIIDEYRNTGGFDMIGSGRTKLEKVDQFEKGLEIIRKLDIKAIVIIGGDDSNTNACVLAEYYAAKKYGVQVIGCPKTIDGDLKNSQIETSFGFDTACKTYSELIGNIERDCNSARKYWHFIKVMGRSASHIALECALQTQPNICLISEEIEQKGMSLDDIVDYIANAVVARAADGNNLTIEKVKGTKASLNAIFEGIKSVIVPGDTDEIFIGQGMCMDRAELLKKRVEEELKLKCTIIWIGPIVGTSCGPGVVACFCRGKEVTRYEGDGK